MSGNPLTGEFEVDLMATQGSLCAGWQSRCPRPTEYVATFVYCSCEEHGWQACRDKGGEHRAEPPDVVFLCATCASRVRTFESLVEIHSLPREASNA